MAHPGDFSERVREFAQRITESGVPALSGLYDLTSERLVRFSTTLTRNQHDAEDAVQTVLVRVALSPQMLCQADRPWSYLLRMVRNESLVLLRKKKRWSLLDNLSDLLVRRTADNLEVEDRHRAIWLALRRLPAEQSEVVVLKIWESFTFQQISDILEIPPATVASRYRYALEKLAAWLPADDGLEVRP